MRSNGSSVALLFSSVFNLKSGISISGICGKRLATGSKFKQPLRKRLSQTHCTLSLLRTWNTAQALVDFPSAFAMCRYVSLLGRCSVVLSLLPPCPPQQRPTNRNTISQLIFTGVIGGGPSSTLFHPPRVSILSPNPHTSPTFTEVAGDPKVVKTKL